MVRLKLQAMVRLKLQAMVRLKPDTTYGRTWRPALAGPHRRWYSTRAVKQFVTLLLALALAGCVRRDIDVPRPIVVQGAMDVEIRRLAAAIESPTQQTVA